MLGIDNLKEKEINGEKPREEWTSKEKKKIKAMKKIYNNINKPLINPLKNGKNINEWKP